MSTFSRRSFLKGLGTSALASAAQGLRQGMAADAPPADPPEAHTLGPGETEVSLSVNGATRTLRLEPRVTLLDALRNRLPLTGAKEVCDRGACGACTVNIDGKPMYACMVLAVDAVGKKITTVEGIARGGAPDVVQRAFVDCDGLMCGFCTPGFIVSARHLLDTNASPSREQIVKACSGNLCRCGAQPHIIAAVEKAAAMARGEVPA